MPERLLLLCMFLEGDCRCPNFQSTKLSTICTSRESWPRRMPKLQVSRSMMSKMAGAVLKAVYTAICAVPAFDFLNNVLSILFTKTHQELFYVCEALFDSNS